MNNTLCKQEILLSCLKITDLKCYIDLEQEWSHKHFDIARFVVSKLLNKVHNQLLKYLKTLHYLNFWRLALFCQLHKILSLQFE